MNQGEATDKNKKYYYAEVVVHTFWGYPTFSVVS